VVGQLSNVMLVPLLGLLLAVALAAVTDSRRIKRVIGAISGICAFVMAVMIAFFIMDFFKVRTLVKPELQHNMAIASTIAAIKDFLTLVTLALLTRAGFTGPKVDANPTSAKNSDRSSLASASPLIGVGTPTRGTPGVGVK
ncbi:MAG TPA: hypothetical protein VIG47_13495, partial [Gemmatimonadaceae bacterium]